MKYFLTRGWIRLLHAIIVLALTGLATPCVAQDNVWTSTTSGNWQDGSWSLGMLPGTNQTIWLTNSGWKAVQIGQATALDFPESLNVDAINISSPTNSFNTLLLNYAGASTPLTVKTMTVASNSAVTMFSSGLQINGPSGQGLMLGGEFDQNDSVVAGNQVNVGYIGPGVYNFNSGYFTVSNLWLGGGGAPGIFNQNGGTNGFGITHLDGGTYVLSNGYYSATIYFDKAGTFQQQGGLLASDLSIFNGSYVLAGGIHQGATIMPSTDGWSSGNAGMLQTGGTNYGPITLGYYDYGYGRYTMSNGVSFAGDLTVASQGSYAQFGGTQTVAGGIDISERQVAQYTYQAGSVDLSGGQLSASEMSEGGYYTQAGGTDVIAGDVTMPLEMEASLSLSGGLLAADNVTLNPAVVGGVFLTGGTFIITNQLWVGGNGYPDWQGFQAGGRLIVSNIWVAPLAAFACRDGVINQSGMLALANASLYSGSNSVQLGPLLLASGGDTNSTLNLVSPTSIMRFADSSSMTWSNGALLIIEGWTGSLNGGGQQQVVFGADAGGLTSAQLQQIQFHNPAGLAAGSYPAKILASGEIVPDSGVAATPSLALSRQSSGMTVTLRGQSGQNYSIEVSTDLVHWAAWTNQTCSNGMICITDTEATNYPARFYRARAVP